MTPLRWAPLLLCGLIAGARAEAPAPALPDEETDVRQLLDAVVVLAAKRPQPLREAPASSSVITAADLEAYGFRDFTEALGSLAGIYLTDPRDFTYLGVRGVSLHGDSNGRVLILVDGHTQQELWSHSAYPEQMGLDASLIDHIEVLRGPASALYGSLGFLAIVNVVTRLGRERGLGQLTYEMQDARSFRGAASIGRRLSPGIELGLQAEGHAALGQAYVYPDLAPNRACNHQFRSSCSGGVSEPGADAGRGFALYGHLRLGRLSLHASYQLLDKHIPFAPYRTLFNDPDNRYLLTRGYVDAALRMGAPSRLEALVRAYYDVAGYVDDLAYTSDGNRGARYLFHDEAHPMWTGAELKLLAERDFARLLHLGLTAGGELTYLRGNDHSGRVGGDAVALAQALVIGAAYGQAELVYSRRIFLTLGLRGDVSDTFPSELSPRAGLVLLPSGRATFKLLYAHGFLRPSWYQTFFHDESAILDNRRLKPERADNYEIVYQHGIAEWLSLGSSLFYIHGDQLIEQRSVCVAAGEAKGGSDDCPQGTSARQQAQNGGSFQSLGGELTLVGRFAGGARFYANYTYAHVLTGSAARPFNSPEHLLKAGISLPLFAGRLVLGGDAQLISSRRFTAAAAAESKPVALFNAHLSLRELVGGFALAIKVYDIAGTTWYEPSQAEDSFPIVRIPHGGPTVVLRLSRAL